MRKEHGSPGENYPTSIAELAAWRKASNTTTEEARRRFIQFVVLASIASSRELASRLALKGGNALHFVHGNRRSTLDLDFTAHGGFPDDAVEIAALLDVALSRAERQFQVKARCSSVRRNPKNPERTFPTYQVNVRYQLVGDRQYQNFEEKRALPIVELEISLNDVLCETFQTRLDPTTDPIWVCSLEDILAEKLRALLQQLTRNRSRPQDVHDIASRMRECGGRINFAKISRFLLEKSQPRGIFPRKTLYDEKVKQRAIVNYDQEIRPNAAVFIPFDEAWNEVLSLVNRLSIPD
jgi:predicted nucleotidyltransferase component of viral defense system